MNNDVVGEWEDDWVVDWLGEVKGEIHWMEKMVKGEQMTQGRW